jgi:hypothetical protein
MVIDKSDRTVRGITAKGLLHIHPANLDDLQRYGFTLAQPLSVQVSAKAARAFILDIYGLGSSATIGFCQKTQEVWFREEQGGYRAGELPIEPLCQMVVTRARQLAEAIGAAVTSIRYLRSQSQDPRLLVSLEPV